MEPQPTNKLNQIAKGVFVFSTVAFCLYVSSRMGSDPNVKGKVSEIVADGLITLAMFVAISYLAAQTVDTSGILNKVASRISPIQSAAMPQTVSAPAQPPQYVAVDPTLVDPGAKG